MDKITITIEQLESLLFEQKKLVAEKLLGMTYYYNSESTDGCSKSIGNIDSYKFKEVAFSSSLPDEFNILKKYSNYYKS